MKRGETVKATLYAHLASAIFNGDTSGLDEQGERELAEALKYIGELTPTDVGESFFGRPETSGLPGEVAEYTLTLI